MIIVRSPLRISLGGGGTDLPSYYRRYGGTVLSGAIDKYVYITVHDTFEQELIVKYSRLEHAASVEEVEHPLVREALRLLDIKDPHIEITSMADIPAGTGLGSSGSFLTALLLALHVHRHNFVNPAKLAQEACSIEIDRLGEPVGKQDQYIAAYGGIACIELSPDDQVTVSPLAMSSRVRYDLEDSLMLFFTGYTRQASWILADQHQRSLDGDPAMDENLHTIKALGEQSKAALEEGRLRDFAELMHVHWEHKRQRSQGMSNDRIDGWYDLARANGAVGGKVIGAGGGGFLLFYTEDPTRLRRAMTEAGLREVRFRFDFEGTKVVVQ